MPIKEKTVIILGAGASKPYQFPLGYELINEIILVLNNEHLFTSFFNNLDTIEGLKRFKDPENNPSIYRKALIDADPASIDDFLNYRPEFNEIGIFSILLCISKYESSDVFQNPHGKRIRDWYSDIWKILYEDTKDYNDFINNKISFITFNYDISFEFYLKNAINEIYKTSLNEDQYDFLNHIKIIHPYGQIGKLCDRYPVNYSTTDNPYVPILNSSNYDRFIEKVIEKNYCRWIYNLSQSIKTYSESPDFGDDIFNEIDSARNYYFFGFGFHAQNLKLLTRSVSPAPPNTKFIYGTCKDIGLNLIPGLYEDLWKTLGLKNGNIKLKRCTTVDYMANVSIPKESREGMGKYHHPNQISPEEVDVY